MNLVGFFIVFQGSGRNLFFYQQFHDTQSFPLVENILEIAHICLNFPSGWEK